MSGSSHPLPSAPRASLRLAGLLALSGALLLRPTGLAPLLARDGEVSWEGFPTAILALRVAAALGGLWLVARGLFPGGRALRGLVLLGAAGFAGVAGVGAWKERHGAPHGRWLPDRVLELGEICTWITRDDPYVGTALVDRQRELLERARATGDPRKLAIAREGLADALLRQGVNGAAVAELEAALELAQASGASDDDRNRIRRSLGVAHLRAGEVSHCIAMHNAARCLFPIRGEGVWDDPSGARKAAELFERILQDRPRDYDVRWLLNLSVMASGGWPDEVPERWRLAPESVAGADAGVPPFRDVAAELGVATFDLAGGVVLDDFDGDGLLDVFTSSMGVCDPIRFYRNAGAQGFVERSEEAGLAGQLGGFNCIQADYDGDGRLDVYVMRGGWQGRIFGRQRNSLLRQEGELSFHDATFEAGLGDDAFPSQVAAWQDVDLDGELDLFVGNEGFPCQLFRNGGDGTFHDVAEQAGVRNEGERGFPTIKGATFGDYDGDGDPDLYVSNYGAPNRLYQNQGDARFVDLAPSLGLAENDLSAVDPAELNNGLVSVLSKDLTVASGLDITFGTWFWDYDNDGWLDLYVGGFGSSLADFAAGYVGERSAEIRRLRIYRNDGRGGFRNVARELGVDAVHLPMGANFGDYDGDGWQDFYLGTGRPGFDFLVPNSLYRNRGGERFVDVTASAGVGHLQKGHGVAFGDVDNDGDLDLFAQMGGFYPADAFHDALFLNQGNDNRWLTLSCRGTRSNRSAIGTRIRVDVLEGGAERSVHALVGSGGSFGASSLQQEIGLGRAERILRVELFWPASGATQVLEGLELDRFYEVVEGADQARPLARPTVPFHG